MPLNALLRDPDARVPATAGGPIPARIHRPGRPARTAAPG